VEHGAGGQKMPGMIAVCGTCCNKDTLGQDSAAAVERWRWLLRVQAVALGQWLSFGQVKGRMTNR
jgi:hypothetical protein